MSYQLNNSTQITRTGWRGYLLCFIADQVAFGASDFSDHPAARVMNPATINSEMVITGAGSSG